jgi:hypothetical protein
MGTETTLVLTVITVGLAAAAIGRVVQVWRRYRGARLVTCPETGHPAAVKIDLKGAVVNALTDTDLHVHLAACSRWETRGHCDEPCLPQIAAGGENSTVEHYVEKWYANQTCRYCGKPVTEVKFLDHRAALLDASGITHEWSEIAPELLPESLPKYAPVCWDCHVAETFRRLRPDLVVDRQRPTEPVSHA